MIHGALGQLWAFTTFFSLLMAVLLGIYLWKMGSEEKVEKAYFPKKEREVTHFKEATSKASLKPRKISDLTFPLKKKFATEDFLLKMIESGRMEECVKTLKQVFVSPEMFEKYKNIFPPNFLNTFKPNEEMAEVWAKESSLSPSLTSVLLEAKRRIARFQPAIVLTEDKEVIDFAESKKIPTFRFEDIF